MPDLLHVAYLAAGRQVAWVLPLIGLLALAGLVVLAGAA